MVYARAPPSFQARYFSFRPPPIASPLPFGTSPTPSLPMPATSALSLNLGVDFSYNASVRSVSPSNFRPTSPAPSVIGSLTRISLNHNPALFSNELEYLYTGKGFYTLLSFFSMPTRKMGPRARQMKPASQNYVRILHICGDLDYTRISSSKCTKMYLP